jgi:hypothetical protein
VTPEVVEQLRTFADRKGCELQALDHEGRKFYRIIRRRTRRVIAKRLRPDALAGYLRAWRGT